MKYKFFLFLAMISSQVFSQTGSLIYVGSDGGMTITTDGIFHADGLSIRCIKDWYIYSIDILTIF